MCDVSGGADGPPVQPLFPARHVRPRNHRCAQGLADQGSDPRLDPGGIRAPPARTGGTHTEAVHRLIHSHNGGGERGQSPRCRQGVRPLAPTLDARARDLARGLTPSNQTRFYSRRSRGPGKISSPDGAGRLRSGAGVAASPPWRTGGTYMRSAAHNRA